MFHNYAFSNYCIEAAHHKIVQCEHGLKRQLSRGECRDLLQDNFDWIENSTHAESLLVAIDSYGFDNWSPRK